MTLFLGSLAALFGVTSCVLACLFLLQLLRNVQLRQRLEEERAWCDEYARQIKEIRREYAKVLWLHNNAIVTELSQAWQQVIKK